jgi:hypothetical protein
LGGLVLERVGLPEGFVSGFLWSTWFDTDGLG